MYWINTMPREAMDRKGHASFPEDFARLRPVETTLDGKALIERLMELQERVNRERSQELQYIISFAEESRFEMEPAHSQLRSLWTAYCLHHNLDVDTSKYDHDLMAIWAQVSATEGDTACWSDFDSFDAFMSADLV